MEAAVHIHHHKEAALIGRELLAFKVGLRVGAGGECCIDVFLCCYL